MYDNNSNSDNGNTNGNVNGGNSSYNNNGGNYYGGNGNDNPQGNNGNGSNPWGAGNGNTWNNGNGYGSSYQNGNPYSGGNSYNNNPYGGNSYGNGGSGSWNGGPGKPAKDSVGRRIGRAVLTGAVAGLVGAGVVCLVGAAVLPRAINSYVNAAAEKVEQSIEDLQGSLPDFSQGSAPGGSNSGNSGQDSPDQNVKSGSDEDADTSSSDGAFLGVICKNISDLEDTDTSDYPDGVYVDQVVDGSPASLGGIKEGDIITSVDDTAVTSFEELSSAIQSHKSGDSVTITIQRKSGDEWKESTHQLTLTDKPQQSSDENSNGGDMFGQIFGGEDNGDSGNQ